MAEPAASTRKRPSATKQPGVTARPDAEQATRSRRGIQTSEFWFAALFVVGVLVAATVLAALDKLSSDDWTKVVTGGGSVPVVGYALARGFTKFGLGSTDASPPGESGTG